MRLAIVLAVILVAGCSAAGPAESTVAPTLAPTTAISSAPTAMPTRTPKLEGVADKTQEKLTVWESDYYVYAQVVAEINNTGGDWVEILRPSSEYTIYAEDGSVTETGMFLYAYPPYVAPGEKGYLCDTAIIEGGVAAAAKVEVDVHYRTVNAPGIVLTVSAVKLIPRGEGFVASAIVKNPSSADQVRNAAAAVIIFGANDALLGCTSTNLIENLSPGESKGFETAWETPPLKQSAIKRFAAFAADASW